MSDLIREAKEQGVDLTVDKLDNKPKRCRLYCKRNMVILTFSSAMPELWKYGPIAEQPVDMIRSMFEVNVFGALNLAQGFIKRFVEKKSGKIIFTSSMGGLWTVPYVAAYCSLKHALESIAEGLRTELAPFNIKIATCNPCIWNRFQ